MEYKKIECNSYNIYTIKTDAFKSCYVEVLYRNSIKKTELTKRNFLNRILSYTTKNFPTRRDMLIEMEELYNANANGIVSRSGNTIMTSYYISFLNPKYTEKKITEKSLKFLFDMIQEPNIKDGKFDQDSFNITKNNIKASIESIKDNPRSYAVLRMLQNIDDSPSSYLLRGSVEELEDITPENLVEFYEKTMQKDVCDIYVIGDLDMDEVAKIIDKYFHNRIIKSTKPKLTLTHKVRTKIKTVKEKDDINQANLVIGCNIEKLTPKEKHIIFNLYNVILGAGSLDTKLAKSLREENSLCYACGSMYQKQDSLLLISAGIDSENFNLAVKIIKQELKNMSNGKITAEEIDNAKKYIVSSLNMAYDNPMSLVNNYLFQQLDNVPSLDEHIKEVNKVTKEEIVAVAKKVKINTIYMLHGGEDNGRN